MPGFSFQLFAAAPVALLLTLAAASAAAVESSFTILVDGDNDPGTGCSVATSAGTMDGVDEMLISVVETSGTDTATVDAVSRRECVDPATDTFGPPIAVDGGWPAGIGAGTDGFHVIETFMPAPANIGPGSLIRLGVVGENELGDEFAQLTTEPGGDEAIVLGVPQANAVPVPVLGVVGLLLLALVVLAVGAVLLRRRAMLAGMALLVLAGGAGAQAFVFMFNWQGQTPLLETGATDPDSGAEVRALFGQWLGGPPARLAFRIDGALVFALLPVAVDDAYSSVETTLLDVAAADGVLANDDLGIPEADVVSFGGGDLGGAVTDHAAGATIGVGADGSLTVNADGSFQFQAETGFEGDFELRYRIENLLAGSEATVTIQVQTPPTAVDDDFDTVVGETLNVAAPGVLDNDSGLPEPSVATFGGGDLGGAATDHAAGSVVAIAPDGSVVVNADGSMAFTPPTGLSGDFAFDYRIDNAAGDAQATITITVGEPPAITSADSHACAVGDPCAFTFTADGFPDPTITLDGALPAGVTFNTATESLEGTPDTGTGAEYNLTVTASNGVTPDDSQAFTLTINEPPTITSADNLTCTAGSTCDFTFTADGFPAPTFALPGLPAGLSLDANTGVLSGTPDANTGAIYSLTLTATNGITPDDSQAFTLTINEAPTITSADNVTCEVGSTCGFTFTADGFPDPTFALPGLPSGLSLDANTGVLSGTPDAGTGAEYNLTLTATNGVAPDDSQAFTLTVNERPAITSADNLTCTVGSSCDFTFTADGFPAPTFSLPGLPAGLSLNATTGVLSGTPAADTGAVYNLTLTATNGITPDDGQAFTLTINEAPTITSVDNLTCQVGDPCGFTFTADGFPDPTFGLPGLPAGLNLNATTGVLSGTPAAGTGAEYNLTLTATNGVNPDDNQAFTLTINEAPTITSAEDLTCILNEPCGFTFTADGFPDPTLSLPGLPMGLSLDANTGALSGTPIDDGEFNLTLTATNTAGSDNQAFTLTIASPPDITSANNVTCEVGSVCAFTFTADGTPAPTIDVTGTLPSGVSFNAATDSLEGTPDAGTGAEYNLTVTANNGINPEAMQAFTLTVNEAPVANNDPEGGIPGTSSPGTVAYHGAFNTTLNVSAADGVLDNDTRGFPQADIVSFDNPSTGAGSVTLNADGSFGYTPASGFTGIDSFAYCIENVGGSDCATVEVAVGERPSATADTYPQTLVGNVGIDTTADSGFSVTASGDAITLGVVSTTNGDATIDSGGTFTFNPAAGVTSANGLLEFSVANGFGTVTATVTIPIGADRIWFADTNAAAGGDGRRGTPFDTLAAAEAAANATGDRIFLHTGSGDYTGGITLLDNQRLLGEGAGQALVTIAAVTPPSDSVLPATGGTAPAIVNGGGNGVTLAQNNRLQGFGVGNTSGSGVAGNGFGTLTVADVSISGTGQALNLTNGSVAGAGFSSVGSSSGSRNVSLTTVGGTLNLGGGTLSGATTQGFFVDGGTGTISYAGSVTNTSNRVAEVRNKTGGSVTLSGNLTNNSGGTGIQVANNSSGTAITFSGAGKVLNTGANAAVTLSGNTGATVNFTNGGLDIDTTSSTGFSATGGGTVNVIGASNTVNAGTGTGVNITNTTIGASGVTFESVSANGAASGIVLDTTGTTGGFTVAGDGATAGSGGTIQNTTSNGVSLATTQDIALGFMNITGSAVNGIFGNNVTGFTLDNSIVSNNGDEVNEGGLRFEENLLGTATISNSTVTGSAEHNIEIINTSGVLNSLTISGSTISTNSATLGADGLLLETRNSAEATVVVTNSTFDDNQSDGIQISAINDSSASLTVNDTTFTSSLDGSSAGSVGARGIVFSASTNADLTVDIGSTTGNVFENFSPNIGEEAINLALVSTSTAASRVSGRINNNTFTNSGGAVGIDLRGDGALVMEIDGNTAGTSRQAIDVITGDAAGDAATADVTITNNMLMVAGTAANPNNEAIGWLGDRDTVSCLNVRGNFGDASGTRADVILDDFTDAAGAVQLESGPTDCGGGACATSEAHLLATNTITDALSSATLVTPGTCATVP